MARAAGEAAGHVQHGLAHGPGEPRCDGQAISQVDQLEFAYPVAGVRRSRNVIHLVSAESRTGVAATADPFFRCQRCRNEWPVEAGTEFVEREGG